jgi:hypothetical protein
VRELELPEALESAEAARNGGRIFPNVRKLKAGVQRAEVLEAFWESWPDLEVAVLSLAYPGTLEQTPRLTSRTLDSILTGFSEESLLELEEHLGAAGDVGMDLEAADGLRTRPSISNWTSNKPLLSPHDSSIVFFEF